MKFLLFGLASMLICKLLSWKSCSKCGSLRTKIVVYEDIGWDYDYDWIPFRGVCRIQHKVKICDCCEDEFIQRQSAELLCGKALNKYVEKMILESIEELDRTIESENQKTA